MVVQVIVTVPGDGNGLVKCDNWFYVPSVRSAYGSHLKSQPAAIGLSNFFHKPWLV